MVPHPVYDCYGAEDIDMKIARARLNLSTDTRVLLFFGLVREYKGLDVLLNSMPLILKGLNGNAHLVVAGEFYEPEERYRGIIDDLSISHITLVIVSYFVY